MSNRFLELATAQRYIRACVDKAGIRVVYTSDAKLPYTDGNTIYIPTINTSFTANDLFNVRYFVLHETLHHIHGGEVFKVLSTPNDKGRLLDTSKPLGVYFNIIEDHGIEKDHVSSVYMGDVELMSEFNVLLEASYLRHIKDLLQKEADGDKEVDFKTSKKMFVMETCVLQARKIWEKSSTVYLDNILDVVSSDPEMLGYYDILLGNDIVTKVFNTTGTKDSNDPKNLALAEEIFKLLHEDDPEDDNEKEDQCKNEDAEGEGGGESSEGAAGEGTEQGKDGEAGKGKKGGKVLYKTNERTDHNVQGKSFMGGALEIDYSQHKEHGAYEMCPVEDVMWYNPNTGKFSGNIHKSLEDYNHERYTTLVHQNALSKAFSNRVRQFMQIKSAARYVPNKKKGKLHSGSLYRLALPKQLQDVRDSSTRIFRRKEQSDILDTAVTILTDFSGSMGGGNKIQHAVTSSVLLNDSISRGLNMPVEVLGFTESGAKTLMIIAKEFDRRISKEKLDENMVKGANYMANNADGDAILWAAQRLLKRKEKRKVLIVLSDGQPSGSRKGDIAAYTKSVVKELEKTPNLTVVGVGINSSSVENFYSHSEVINDVNELETKVLKVLKDAIINHH